MNIISEVNTHIHIYLYTHICANFYGVRPNGVEVCRFILYPRGTLLMYDKIDV